MNNEIRDKEICSAVIPVLPLISFNFPSRFAFTQLDRVCSTTPKLRAAFSKTWIQCNQIKKIGATWLLDTM